MIRLPRKIRLYLMAATLVGFGMFGLFDLSSWQKLEAVTLDGIVLEEWPSDLAIDSTRHVTEQPLQRIADQLLERPRTAKVDIDYDLPRGIRIETNRFEPVATILAPEGGRLYGLNKDGRLIHLPPDHDDWEQPVITGARIGRLFELNPDPRVIALIEQLIRLADEDRNLFRLIDEIDLTSPHYAMITISGLAFKLRANADELCSQILRFVDFLQKYQPDVSSARVIDLRLPDMVIQEGGKS